jgi:uracil-DNA glycosylase family 4
MTRQEAIDQIAREIRRSRRCLLAGGVGSPVPGEGPADAQIFFVGQSPGLEESRTGRPFVERAGKFLDEALRRAGLSRQGVFITSVREALSAWQPAAEACKPALLRQLDVVDPCVVVLLGGSPRGRSLARQRWKAAACSSPLIRLPRCASRGFRLRFFRDLHRLRRLTRRP